MTEITIREFADDDAPRVRELFIQVNRLLSPPDLSDAFEGYSKRALAEEIGRITDYYGQRNGGFLGGDPRRYASRHIRA